MPLGIKLIASMMLGLLVHVAKANVHLVIYATHNGKTGHAGMAIDDYLIKVVEYQHNSKVEYRYDTTATGFVSYYDLWPLNDTYKGSYDKDVAPIYYALPSTKWKRLISLKTLSEEGLPHKEGYPCDGILTIPTTKADDFRLRDYLKKKMDEAPAFNAMHHNCCDFVADALTFLTGKSIKAKEFIIKSYARTPNLLYKEIAQWPGVVVYKDAGKTVEGSFMQQRILSRLIPFITNY